MTHEEFDHFVRDIETGVGRDPAALRRRVFRLALLGYTGLLAPLAAVVVVSLAMIIPGIVWFPDAAPFLIIGAFTLPLGAWASCYMLWIRLPAPEGRALTRAETPALFDLIDDIRRRTRAAPFQHVLIIPDCNAAVSSSPRLGLLGWNRNFLLLGLPLMEGLSPAEFASVLAHECAHMSRLHHRSGQWIYRLRRSWEQVFKRYSQPRVAREISLRILLRKFIGWFWPRFNAHAFVLSRSHEYEADAVAAEIAGKDAAALSLIRNAWHSRALGEKFWPDLWRQTAALDAPPDGVFAGIPAFFGSLGESDIKWLDHAFNSATTNADTHPCLTERLRAIGWPADPHTPRMANALVPPRPNSAELLLGVALPSIRADVEKLWRKRSEANWLQQHRKVTALQDRLQSIDSTPAPCADVDALWDKARVLLEMHSPDDAEPLLRRIIALDPKHVAANFNLGGFLLRSGNTEGGRYLEAAITENEDLLPQAVQSFHAYYQQSGRPDLIRQLYARLDKYEKDIAASRLERSNVTAADHFIPHELPEPGLAALRQELEADPDVTAADLACKELRHFVTQKFFVLCVRAHPAFGFLPASSKSQAAVTRLIKTVRLPGRVLIISPHGPFRAVAKKVARVPGARIFER